MAWNPLGAAAVAGAPDGVNAIQNDEGPGHRLRVTVGVSGKVIVAGVGDAGGVRQRVDDPGEVVNDRCRYFPAVNDESGGLGGQDGQVDRLAPEGAFRNAPSGAVDPREQSQVDLLRGVGCRGRMTHVRGCLHTLGRVATAVPVSTHRAAAVVGDRDPRPILQSSRSATPDRPLTDPPPASIRL